MITHTLANTLDKKLPIKDIAGLAPTISPINNFLKESIGLK